MSPKPLTYFTALSMAAHAALFGLWSPPERTAVDHQESSIEIGLVVLPAIDKNFSSPQARQQPVRQQNKQTRQQNKEAVTAQARSSQKADQPEQARRPTPPAVDQEAAGKTTAAPAAADQAPQEPATHTEQALASPDQAGSSPLVATEAAPLTSANPAPHYPAEALRYGWEGEVWLQVAVDRSGAVDHVRIDKSSGYPVLDRAARKTVQRWLFEPARIGEETIDATVRVPVRFKIERS